MRHRSWFQAAPLLLAVLLATFVVKSSASISAQGSEERVLYVSALDSKGMPVDGLGPEAFAVRENGVRREVLRAARATEPIDLTVLIDNSQAASDDVGYYRAVLPKFLSEVSPNNLVSLIGLADRPTVVVPATKDTKQLVSRASSMFAMPGSGMTLLDALVEVSDGLRRREGPRAAIVAIFTDGPEFTNRYAKDVVASVKRVQAAVHLVTIGQFRETLEHEVRERSIVITQLPEATGGSHLSMLAPSGLGGALDRLSRDLRSQYKVVYARPQSTIPPNTIEVSAAREGLTVRGTPERSAKGA